jgi:hypothetical protein
MVELALQLLLLAHATVAPQPTAADVLRAAKNAIIGAQSVVYIVTRDYTDSAGNKVKGRTRVLIAKSPFGFRAEHRRDDDSQSETAVSDGKTTRTLTDGKPDQNPTFGPEGPQWSMNIGGNADSDVLRQPGICFLMPTTSSGRSRVDGFFTCGTTKFKVNRAA